MKKFFLLIILLIIAWAGASFGLQVEKMSRQGHSIPVVSPRFSINPVTPQPQIGIPQTIQIPKINISAAVEQVGLDAQGRMDVPKSSDDVGWYSLGYKPGERGNAVIDGHLDKETGAPAVFWDINKLEPGDRIIVTDSQGIARTFTVVRMDTYPYNNFPIKDIFGEADKPMLHLITCQGTWDAANHNYSNRVVVSAELVE